MGLLLVLGVMNLLWIAGLASFILLGKVVPGGDNLWVSRASGVLMAGWGAWIVVRALA
jgi:predicted metal-binding membrane protein